MAVHSLSDLRQMLVSTDLTWPPQLALSLLSSNTAWEQLVYSVFLDLNQLLKSYRIVQLGFLGPDGSTNLGLSDCILALQFLQKVAPSFGGSSSKITVAGQSSGATLIRALLAVPSASSLFQSAILQSDPMVRKIACMQSSADYGCLFQDYGFLAPSVQQKMQSAFNSDIHCKGTDKSCLNRLSLNTILAAQDNIYNNAATQIDPSTGTGEPIRVVRDGKLITSPLDSTAPFPHSSKPILLSNVLDEAAAAIYSVFPDTVPEDQFEECVNATVGSSRTQQLLSSSHYSLPSGVDRATADARVQLQQLATDYLWKCPTWTFGRNWAGNGGNVFMGMYVVGATYPGNDEISYCTNPGVVCHQDDIEIVVRVISFFALFKSFSDDWLISSSGPFLILLRPSHS